VTRVCAYLNSLVVAVTGLPEAQPNHSLLMTKFSRACLDTFRKLTEKLVAKLGPDTR